jgi:hypothetical protein
MTARFLTPIQNIAINLVFAVMGERRCNRTRDEYDAISARLPPLKRLVWKVNEELKSMHARAARSGVRLPQICRFKAGDERWDYEEYPRSISYETLRAALNVSELRSPSWRKSLE